jgi:hypothetical protein
LTFLQSIAKIPIDINNSLFALETHNYFQDNRCAIVLFEWLTGRGEIFLAARFSSKRKSGKLHPGPDIKAILTMQLLILGGPGQIPGGYWSRGGSGCWGMLRLIPVITVS